MTAMMNVVICDEPQRLRLARMEIPARGEREVLVRVRRVGICGTDMHIVRGTQPYLSYPRIMGHEMSGEVAEAPAASALKAGEHVLVMPYLSCGACDACRKGLGNCCRNIQVLGVHRDGGMAEYISVPEAFVRSTEGVSLDDAAMVEFLSIGAHAVARAKISSGQRVLVVGAGPIGMATGLFSGLDGAQVSFVDSRPDRLKVCVDHLGAAATFGVTKDLADQLRVATHGDLFDVVFDATGSARAIETGFDFVAHGGTYVLLSVVSDRISFSDPDFHRREMTLMGSRNASVADFDRVLQAIRDGKVPTRVLNTHRARLDQLAEVMPVWMSPEAGVIKGIIEC
jgi:2-desacetyl-2-hydroxyethyl bacteriochlorophyllide A dehydrogenase